jgi:dihydropteroate synthase
VTAARDVPPGGGPQVLRAGRFPLDVAARPLIVGVLNATPNSFYDGGRYFARDRALARADELAAEGADLVEVGGETARPDPPAVDIEEERRRVVPLIETLAARLHVPVAVDTYKPEVARAAVEAGAVLINDISGLADPRMAEIAAAAGAALVVMHIRGRPKVRQIDPRYESVVDEVYAFLETRTEQAKALGVPADRLIIDPGLSFGKAPRHDLDVLRGLRTFGRLGYPIYLATSRKTYIRDILALPVEELLEGTMAAVAYGVLQGVHFVRTHDVRAIARVIRMTLAIVNGREESHV